MKKRMSMPPRVEQLQQLQAWLSEQHPVQHPKQREQRERSFFEPWRDSANRWVGACEER